MGEVARTLVSLSGPNAVIGVIPRALMEREKGFALNNSNPAATEKKDWTNAEGTQTPDSIEVLDTLFENAYGRTTIVPDMHTRKRLMAKYVMAGPPGSGFVALPGGYGTLEELMEVVTWNQLGIHKCGIVVCNINGYWDGLMGWVRKSVEEGFVREKSQGIFVECKEAEGVVEMLRAYRVAEGRFKLDWGEE
jgi:uncharacterized protein (TIGR00730 family)